MFLVARLELLRRHSIAALACAPKCSYGRYMTVFKSQQLLSALAYSAVLAICRWTTIFIRSILGLVV